jgi:hypothetical protein
MMSIAEHTGALGEKPVMRRNGGKMTAPNNGSAVLRPSLLGSWVLFCGFFMGLAVVYFDRDPQGSDLFWYALSGFFLALIIHRLTRKYILSQDSVTSASIFGDGATIAYKDIADVEVRRTLSSRAAGAAHLLIYGKGGQVITMASQLDADALREALLRLAGLAAGPGQEALEGGGGGEDGKEHEGEEEDGGGGEDDEEYEDEDDDGGGDDDLEEGGEEEEEEEEEEEDHDGGDDGGPDDGGGAGPDGGGGEKGGGSGGQGL